MLGLLDLLRAVKGTLTIALRRTHPLVGAAAVAVLWMGAIGAMFTLTRPDPSPSPEQALSHIDDERPADRPSTATSEREDEGGSDDDGTDWPQTAESTRTPAAADGGLDTPTSSTGAEPGTEPDGELGAPRGTTPSTRPRPGGPSPSWATSSTTTTTSPEGATSSTTTTAPPAGGGNGGLLGGLLDLLGLGG